MLHPLLCKLVTGTTHYWMERRIILGVATGWVGPKGITINRRVMTQPAQNQFGSRWVKLWVITQPAQLKLLKVKQPCAQQPA